MAPDTEVLEVEWNPEELLDGREPEELLEEAETRATAFAERYRGKLAELDGEGLKAAMEELAAIGELEGRAGYYAMLRFSTDTADPARGALLQKVQERATSVQTTLLFFDLEWAAVPDDRAEELLATPGIEFCGHHLRSERRYRPYLLSEAEEKILAERAQTGRSAWVRLFEELTSAIEVDLPDAPEPVALDVALSRLQDPDRAVRQATSEAVTTALKPGLRTRAFLFNTLIHDKAVEDRLRGYEHWLAARNLSNEASDESVAALVDAVKNRYGLARRWYAQKATMLGLDKLADYDRMCAVTEDDEDVRWADAREIVSESYNRFSGDLGNLVGRFFDEGWIDAPVRPAKRGGAYCAGTVPSAHPYVMLNYTSKRRDVLTLAHELGHGVHFALAAKQGIFHQGTPLTTAETASVFGETLTFAVLLERAETPESRLSLLAEAIEGQIATVFRQVAMNQFEDRVHTARRAEGELSVERFGELWTESQEELLGDAVEVTDNYRCWWSYIPHFIGSPGYVYAYAFGQLLALAVYARSEEEGPSFVPKYLELLSAGGSKPPEEIGRLVGVDLGDPTFWDGGLDLVERQLEAAEQAARDAGRL